MPAKLAISLAEAYNIPMQTLGIGIILFSAYPLAYVYSLLPTKAASVKHLFSIIVTTVLFCGLLDTTVYLQLLAACIVTYGVVSIGRTSAWTPVSVCVGMLALLSTHHLENQIWNPDEDRPDHTGPIMMMVIKLSTFAWAAHDGSKKEETLSKEQRRVAIYEMPSLVEFLGYALFFGGWCVGPANDFSDYRKFTRGEPPFDHIPARGMAAAKTFAMGLFTISINMKYSVPLAHHGILTKEFAQSPFWYRLLYVNLAGNVVRCKYYGAWKLAEGACIVSGIGYLGPCPSNPGKQLFKRVQNVEPLTLELAQSPREYIGAWNQQTGKWLRECVYLRISPQHSAPSSAKKKHGGGRSSVVANIATYFTSAIWHGFRPGYYLTFLSGALVTISGQLLRRNLRPLVVQPSRLAPSKPVYDFLGWLGTQISINYICAPFPVYWLPNGLKVWASVYYMVHVWNLVTLIIFGVLGGGKLCRTLGKVVGADYTGHRRLGQSGKVEIEKSVRDTADVLATEEDTETKEIKDKEI